MSDREEHERKWKRHLEKLRTKKKPDADGKYEIKTPIPSNQDRCFVCSSTISAEVGYKEHLQTSQHLSHVENNPLYLEIDKVIDELNLEVELQRLRKQKSGIVFG